MTKTYNPDMGSMDDLDDLPQFKAPPSGAYTLVLPEGFIFKPDVNKHSAETFNFTIKEIKEQSEQVPAEEQVAVGDMFSCAFMMDNDTGAGFFKEMIKPMSEKFKTKNISELRNASKGMEIIAIIQRTYSKEKQKHYAKIKAYDFV